MILSVTPEKFFFASCDNVEQKGVVFPIFLQRKNDRIILGIGAGYNSDGSKSASKECSLPSEAQVSRLADIVSRTWHVRSCAF